MCYKHFIGASQEWSPAKFPDDIDQSLQTHTNKASVPHRILQCRCITIHYLN